MGVYFRAKEKPVCVCVCEHELFCKCVYQAGHVSIVCPTLAAYLLVAMSTGAHILSSDREGREVMSSTCLAIYGHCDYSLSP